MGQDVFSFGYKDKSRLGAIFLVSIIIFRKVYSPLLWGQLVCDRKASASVGRGTDIRSY